MALGENVAALALRLGYEWPLWDKPLKLKAVVFSDIEGRMKPIPVGNSNIAGRLFLEEQARKQGDEYPDSLLCNVTLKEAGLVFAAQLEGEEDDVLDALARSTTGSPVGLGWAD